LLKQGLDAALEISRYHTIADCAFRLGNIRQAQQESQEALTYYHLALDKYRRLGIEKRITEVEEAIQSLEQKFTATAGRTLLARGARLPDTVSSYWRDARIWDRWEVEFSEANKNEHVRQRELTVDAVKRLGAPQVRVMDLCCGTGRVTHDLLSLPNVTEVVAADISDKALDLLTARLHDHPAIGKLRYLRADMMAGSEIYELGRFDIVVCLDSLHHLWDLPTALSRIGELLNDQGMLIANFLVAERVPRHVVAKKGWGRYLRGHILARLFVFLGFIKGVWRFSGRKGIVRFSMLSRPALLPIIRERFRIIESADSDYYWFVATPR
jgi:SAM-dependent methyltransferase